MKRKKLLYLPIVLAVLLLFAGCGNSDTGTAAPDNAPEVSEDTAQTPETTAVPEESGTPDLEDADAVATETEAASI